MYSGEKRCTSIEILDDAIVEKNTENIRVQFMTSPFSASLSDAYIWIQDNDGEWYKCDVCHLPLLSLLSWVWEQG